MVDKVQTSFYKAVKTVRECNVFTEHQDKVTCVAFSPLNDFIVSGSKDTSIRFWNKYGSRTYAKGVNSAPTPNSRGVQLKLGESRGKCVSLKNYQRKAYNYKT